MSRDSDVAIDLAQLCSLRILSGVGDLDYEANIDLWAFKTAKVVWTNECLKQVRKRKNRYESIDFVEAEMSAMIANPLMEGNREISMVQALPELQREAVLLVYVEKMSYRDAAEIIGAPLGTVMNRLAEARRKLTLHDKYDGLCRDAC